MIFMEYSREFRPFLESPSRSLRKAMDAKTATFFGERVLIVAPTGHDAANASEVLGKDGIGNRVCASVPELCALAAQGAAALVFTQESLTPTGLGHLGQFLNGQPPWSDLPLIL